MHNISLAPWLRDHTFGHEKAKPEERRILSVIAVTGVTMVIEVVAGLAYGSMALLADGIHMGSHFLALGISALAYYYTRRHATNREFSFGTGKIGSLAGFSGAGILLIIALAMGIESVRRLASPHPIIFNQAILVAVLGLLVNGISLFLLRERGHDHNHPHEHEHDGHSDHNLLSAYLHVLADALTSILAIAALVSGKYFGMPWMDPVIGVAGAVLVARWSVELGRLSSRVLLDFEAPLSVRHAVRKALEKGANDRVCDLHIWSIGPGMFAAEISVVTTRPREPEHYARLLPEHTGIVHSTFQVHRCRRLARAGERR